VCMKTLRAHYFVFPYATWKYKLKYTELKNWLFLHRRC
jgi:hypothetical protein